MSIKKIMANFVFLLASGIIFVNTASGEARKLDIKTILNNSSSKGLKLSEGRIILDNDESFDSKLEIIRNAKKNLRLSYFIYTSDFSSSVFTDELIKAAKRGVKVKLLVDGLTNYKYLDLFSMMEVQGDGNIEVKFYNLPSEKIMRDVLFMTTDCTKVAVKVGNECEKEKRAKIAGFLKNKSMKEVLNSSEGHFAQLFLTGFLTKQMDALKASLFIGQSINLEALKKGATATPEEKEKLTELLKLIINAKMGKIGAKIQLALAISMYGDTIRPIMNEISGKIPMMGADPIEAMGAEWSHFTDYTHQKLILSDSGTSEAAFQVGGRNVEDSYHMKRSESLPVHKYIFMDTDFIGKIKESSGSEEIAKSFDIQWNWKEMVKDLKTVRELLPNDMVKNIDLYLAGLEDCAIQAAIVSAKKQITISSASIAKCTNEQFEINKNQKAFLALKVRKDKEYEEKVNEEKMSNKKHKKEIKKLDIQPFKSLDERVDAEFNLMKENSTSFQSYRSENLTPSIKLSENDLKNATVTYIENVPYNKDKSTNPPTRIYGVEHGKEAENGKHIQEIWKRSMENICAVTAKGKERKQVVLHNAYFFAPPIMLETLGNMINGTWDCRNVDVTILTNSLETTDLNIMNLFARHQLQALYEFYRNPKFSNSEKKASLRYFEYIEPENSAKKLTGQGHAEQSLHTKVAIFGDDIYIGSANLDLRNYAMDANNGVYLSNAKDLVAIYSKHINEILNNKNLTSEGTTYLMDKETTEQTALNDVLKFMEQMQKDRAKLANKLDEDKKKDLTKLAQMLTEDTYKLTRILITPVNGEPNDPNQLENEVALPEGGLESLSFGELDKYKAEVKKKRDEKRLKLIQEFIDAFQLI